MMLICVGTQLYIPAMYRTLGNYYTVRAVCVDLSMMMMMMTMVVAVIAAAAPSLCLLGKATLFNLLNI